MDYTLSKSPQEISVKLTGQFTFSDTQKFKNILELITEDESKSIILNFADVSFIDSSSMGMLLLLRDECHLRNISLRIVSPQGQVKKIFAISKFDKLFSIT